MWASGDFAVIGTTLQIVGELLCEAVDLRAGERVLDVAAGNGNATLAAARRFARVTSTDYVPALLERGRRRAEAEGLDVTFEVADAEALPYPTGELRRRALDVRRHVRARSRAGRQRDDAGVPARRPHRPGLVDAAGLPRRAVPGRSPSTCRRCRAFVRRCCGAPTPTSRSCSRGAASIEHTVRHFAFRYRSPEHLVEVFRTFYGPVHKAFAALDADGQAALEADLIALLRKARPRRRRRPRRAGGVSGNGDHAVKTLRLMCVLAHPDDESLGTGGTLAKYAAEGVETYLVTATRGERGRFGDSGERPGAGRRRHRRARPSCGRRPRSWACARSRSSAIRMARSTRSIRQRAQEGSPATCAASDRRSSSRSARTARTAIPITSPSAS